MEAMVVSRGSPVRKHYLVSQLKRLRAEARLSQEQVAEEMGWDVSKLYRIENGRFVRLNPESVAALCRLYRADDGLFEELVAIAKAARRHKPWWSQFEEGAGNDFYSVEYEATLIEEYAVGLVPELVQHPDYWAALVRRRVPAGSAEYQKLCAALRQRQAAVLERDDPPRFWSVVDESALRCAVGGPQVMRAQLTHLLELVKHPNLVIQVLPLSQGMAHPATFTVLRLDGGAKVGYIGVPPHGCFVDGGDRVAAYAQRFELLQATALPPQETPGYLRRVLAELEDADG